LTTTSAPDFFPKNNEENVHAPDFFSRENNEVDDDDDRSQFLSSRQPRERPREKKATGESSRIEQ
jgi:hypothetical protein